MPSLAQALTDGLYTDAMLGLAAAVAATWLVLVVVRVPVDRDDDPED